ncbi:MAG: S-methyl-5'-thioinosine phosphorylase [Pseudomonadota bacterium]
MHKIGVIGGSGISSLKELEILHREIVSTPYGEASAPLTHGRLGALDLIFMPRHGSGHTIPPHAINYRANVWAMKELGVEQIIGLATVGGITQPPLAMVIPDQLIDYSWGREHTFFDGEDGQVSHVDFSSPFCGELRQTLTEAALAAGIDIVTEGVYGVTQGPRLETAAEIGRLHADGCDIVGMTALPEAALAREKGLCYATCAIVVNWAAGKGDGVKITQELIDANLEISKKSIGSLLQHLGEGRF